MGQDRSEDKEYLRALLLACVGEVEINENKWLIPFEDRIDPKYFHYRVKSVEAGGSKKAFNKRCVENLETLFGYLFKIKNGGGGFTEKRAIDGCNNAIAALTQRFGIDLSGFANDECLTCSENKRRREGLYKILCESFACYACSSSVTATDVASWAAKHSVDDRLSFAGKETGWTNAQTLGSFARNPELIGVLLFDDPDDRAFDYAAEQRVWKRLSNMVSGGMPIDQIIAEGLKRGTFRSWGPDAEAFMQYFMAKFCIKRGNVSQGLEYMMGSGKVVGSMPKDNADRLSALIGLRRETVKPISRWNSETDFMASLDRLQGLGVPDSYIAYESASVIGVEAANSFAFMLARPEAPKDLTPFSNKLMEAHDALLERHPQALRNQEVVNLSLHWFNSLLSYRRTGDEGLLADVLDAAKAGFLLSKRRFNNLFYAQSVLVLAIYLYASGEMSPARFLVSVHRHLAEEFGLTEHQEGFGALFDCLRAVARSDFSSRAKNLKRDVFAKDAEEIGRLFGSEQPYDCDLVSLLGI